MAEHEERLSAMVDRRMYATDATYNAQVTMCHRWLAMTELAMTAEGISSETAERVLDRLVFGVPQAENAWLRQFQQQALVEALTRGVPRV